MRFICASDGCSPRVYDDFWSEDPVDVAAEYAEPPASVTEDIDAMVKDGGL